MVCPASLLFTTIISLVYASDELSYNMHPNFKSAILNTYQMISADVRWGRDDL